MLTYKSIQKKMQKIALILPKHTKWKTETYSVPEQQSHNSTQKLQNQTDCQCVEKLQRDRWAQKSISTFKKKKGVSIVKINCAFVVFCSRNAEETKTDSTVKGNKALVVFRFTRGKKSFDIFSL